MCRPRDRVCWRHSSSHHQMLKWSRRHIPWIVRWLMVWCTTLKVISHCFNFATYTSILQLWLGCIPVSQCNRQTSKISTFRSLEGFHLLKRNLHFPFEQWSFTPGWLGYAGDYTTQLYRDYNRQLWGSLLSNQHFMKCYWWGLITAIFCFPFFFPPGIRRIFHRAKKNPPPLHRAPRWFHWQEWPWRIYVTWSWKKYAQNPDRSCGGWVFGPGCHVVLGCPVGS